MTALFIAGCMGPAGTSFMMEQKTEYRYYADGSVSRIDSQVPHKDSQRIAASVAIAGMGGNGIMMAVGAAADHIGMAIAKTLEKPQDILFLGKANDEATTVTVYRDRVVYKDAPVSGPQPIPPSSFGQPINY